MSELLQTVNPETGIEGVIPLTSIADVHYVHEQNDASDTWTVTHNLGKRPAVAVVDTGDNVIVPDLEYTNGNTVVLYFSGATSGKAYLN